MQTTLDYTVQAWAEINICQGVQRFCKACCILGRDVAYLKDSKGNFDRRKTGYYIYIYIYICWKEGCDSFAIPWKLQFLSNSFACRQIYVIFMQRCFCHVIQQYINAFWRDVVLTEYIERNFHAKDTRKSHLKSTQWSQGDHLELDPWVTLTNIQSNGNLYIYICVKQYLCILCMYIYLYIILYLHIDQLILWFLANDNHHNKHLRPEAWTWDEHVGRVAEERSWENHRIIQRMNCWYRKIRAILHLHAGTQYQYIIQYRIALV